MEMWHNGKQASGATIAVGATQPRVRGFHHICTPLSLPPPLLLSLTLTHSRPSASRCTGRYVQGKNFNVVPL